VRVYDSVVDLVGGTPLVRLTSVTRGGDGVEPVQATVLAKVEYLNPGGSVKDRIALAMVEAAERDGLLQPGGTIVEPTSGNTGVGLALVAQQRGYQCVFVCPDKVSADKIRVLQAYGAKVVVCPTAVPPEHPDSYYNVSDRLSREIPGAWKPDQYSNPNNPRSHYESTGPEVWADTDGRVTCFVAGVGTGGTISGAGRYLKEVSGGGVRIVGADPEGSVYSGGAGRPYLVEGVGEDFWPQAYDRTVCDEIVAVSDADSFEMTRRLAPRPLRWRSRAGSVRTTSSSCCCRTPAAAICRRCSTTSGSRRTASSAPGRAAPWGTCCGQSPASCRSSCTRTRTRPSPRR